jgi:tight adherence protein C
MALISAPIVLALVFLTFIALGVGVLMLFRNDAGAKRIGKAAEQLGGSPQAQPQGAELALLMHDDNRPSALRILEPLQRRLVQSDSKQVTLARERLIEAGFYARSAVEAYFTIRILAAAGFGLASSLYFLVIPVETAVQVKMLVVLASVAFGFYAPVLMLQGRIDRRRTKFKEGMPDALDMMLVGVEAGLSLSAAIKHIVKEFAAVHPVVSEQFQIVTLEFQAGRSRADTMNSLARRMKIPMTRTLASMIVQAETLGVSMAQTLQVLAQELRTQRMLEAEKKAAELPVKMTIPLVLCIFPSLMAVALVPAMIGILNFFADLKQG